jgi:hypothetical protein
VDKGISGSRERRPALDQLMAICRKRLVDAVVVYRYDRFARSLRQLVLALEEFRALGRDQQTHGTKGNDWVAPKPLLQPRPQVLDLPPHECGFSLPKTTGCGQSEPSRDIPI